MLALLAVTNVTNNTSQTELAVLVLVGVITAGATIGAAIITMRANRRAAKLVVKVAQDQAETATQALLAATEAKRAASQAAADAASAAVRLVQAAVESNALLATIKTQSEENGKTLDIVHKQTNDMVTRQLRRYATLAREISDLKPGDKAALKAAQAAELDAESKEDFEDKALAQRKAK
jgi:hypothetical protein